MNSSIYGIINDLDREGFGYAKRVWNTYQYFKKHGFRRPYMQDQMMSNRKIPFHEEMDLIRAQNDRILANAARRNAKPRGYYPAGYPQRPQARTPNFTYGPYRKRRARSTVAYPSSRRYYRRSRPQTLKLTPYRRRFRYFISRRTPTLYNYNRRTRWFAGKVRSPVRSRYATVFRRRRRF